MKTFVLVMSLYSGGPIVEVPVDDCKAGVAWIHEAWDWAKRAGMSETGPMYVCFPADKHVEIASR